MNNKDLQYYRAIIFDIRNDLAVHCRRKLFKFGDAVLSSITDLINILQDVTTEALNNPSLSHSDKSSLWCEVETLLEQFKSARVHLRAIKELQQDLHPHSSSYTFVTEKFLRD